MGVYVERLYADPVMQTVQIVFSLFLLLFFVDAILRKSKRLQAYRFRAAALGAFLLWPILISVLPTRWGDPVDAFILDKNGERRFALRYHARFSRKSSSTTWAAIRTFDAKGTELGHSLWTGSRPLSTVGSRRFYSAKPGFVTYEHGVVAVDLWTGEEPFYVDDALGDVPVKFRAVEGDTLVYELQNGDPKTVKWPIPAPEISVRELRARDDRKKKAFGVFDVQELGCDLVLFRDVSFGEGPTLIGRIEQDSMVWRKTLEELGLSEPIAGTIADGDACWVLGGRLVRLDSPGEVQARVP